MTLDKRRTLLAPLAALAATAAVFAGCGGGGDSAGSATAGTTATAQAAAEVAKQPVLTGTHAGEAVEYFDFGDIKLEDGNTIAGMWTVTGGADGQGAIFDNVPGTDGYSALRRVSEVAWADGATPRALGSVADVRAAEAAGEVTVTATERVVNAPILGFDQVRHAGFAKGETIDYYELGVVKVAPGNEVLPIWTFTNGVADQKNIADTEPGTTAYPPLWAVVEATWADTATPRLITSFEDMKAAEADGELTLTAVPGMIVNCPFL